MAAQEAPPASYYLPQFHGAIRTRWEGDMTDGTSRFQVRNARLTMRGNISDDITYFTQIDLCDRGKFRFLDAWGQIRLTKGLNLRAGQFKSHFGVESYRGPATYFFANRSNIEKDVCNYREVGARLSYAIPATPLSADIGAFNPTSIADHDVWVKQMAYTGRLCADWRNLSLAAACMTLIPDSVRMNIFGISARLNIDRLTFETEALCKHYCGNHGLKNSAAYYFVADYTMPITAGAFNRLSFQGRFDGITDHSTGYRDTQGRLYVNHPAHNRITAGTTISKIVKGLKCDLRLNYEKYFYHRNVTPPTGLNDKIVAEMVIKF